MAKDEKARGIMSTSRAVTYALAFFAVGMLLWYIVPGLISRDEPTHRQSETGANSNQAEVQRRFDPARDRQVTLGDAILVPTGTPVTLEKNRLAPVETSREGLVLWSTTRTDGGGGGEADNMVPAIESAHGPVYAELADGRFQQLKQVQGNRDTPPGTNARDRVQ
jgi:hypothetical protein